MDQRLLKFAFMGNVIEVLVEDIDKVMWIDLIIECEEGFRKNNYDFPKFPSFHYCYKMKDVKITSDSDLMSMLDRLRDRDEITVWIGCADRPSDCVVAARKLGETQKCNPPTENAEVDEQGGNEQCPDGEDYWNDVRIEMELEQNAPIDDAEEYEEEIKQKRKKKAAPKRLKTRKKMPLKRKLEVPTDKETMPPHQSFSNAPVIHQKTDSTASKFSCNSAVVLHKIPSTTAARKKVVQAKDFEVVGTNEIGENSRVVSSMNEGADMEDIRAGVEDDIVEGAGMEDDIVEGAGMDDDGAGMDDDDCEEDDDEIGSIHDNYDPYISDCWQKELVADDTYLSRLYKNGEFVSDVEFGSIVLKPWMIFIDKEHFMSVFRDYCVQSGFAVVVDRSSPRRFTASCRDLNCGWKIHSSRLPDGVTWAIKTIKMENKTNFVESFNSTLGVDRCKPVLTLLEGIRRMCMVRLSARRQRCNNWNEDEPCPNILKRIKKLTFDSRTCKAYQSKEGEYEVSDGKSMLPVSLNNKTCLCGLWQISGLPCKHAIRAIMAARLNPYTFASTWFSVHTYKQAYSNSIHSVPDSEHWPEIDMPTILPPKMTRAIGRPSRQRRRAADEPAKGKRSTTVQCKRCMSYGHNQRTCKGGLTAAEQSAMDGKKIEEAKAKNAARKISESKAKANTAPMSTSTANPPIPPKRFTRSSLLSASQPQPSINTTQHEYQLFEGQSSQPVTRSMKYGKGKTKV